MNANGAIFTAYHKKFPIPDVDIIFPIHTGRDCTKETKDGKIKTEELEWLESKTIGDNTGDNISKRNREYSECTALYWAWKNVDINKYKYVGLNQYRRMFILNDEYDKARNNQEKEVHKCVHYKADKKKLTDKIGLTDANIVDILSKYDVIVPYPCDLEKKKIHSVYEDWVVAIPGVHVNDLVMLEEKYKEFYPAETEAFSEYLNSPNKMMYQIFITTPKIFNEYCEWLFDILFKIEKNVNVDLYTTNGKRTMGYLAEVLYGFYFMHKEKKGELKVRHCGVAYLDD